ncbi:hypothetical protein BV898_09583 [Hypsibius exemplaris]|uniref:BRCT domain-containing protein n=1 Tax=Hypsibius exemplaris TaxID=2072580 RepID=A0A1W0WM50_HYPEX|nr:hypothetical protein BV898_09583 [Hypsibius exemplaris]
MAVKTEKKIRLFTGKSVERPQGNRFKIGDTVFGRQRVRTSDVSRAEVRYYEALFHGINRETGKMLLEWKEDGLKVSVDPADVVDPEQLLKPGLVVMMSGFRSAEYVPARLIRFCADGRHGIAPIDFIIKVPHKVQCMMVKEKDFVAFQKETMLRRRSSRVVIKAEVKDEPQSDSFSMIGPSNKKQRNRPDNPFGNILSGFLILISGEQDTKDVKDFQEDRLVQQITKLGGRTVDDYDDLISAELAKRVCVAPTFLRTVRYMQCLAGDIPCVASNWITDMIAAGKYLPYMIYLLPAGIVSHLPDPVPWRPRNLSFLCGWSIGFFGLTHEEEHYWKKITAVLGSSMAVVETGNLAMGALGDKRGVPLKLDLLLMPKYEMGNDLMKTCGRGGVPVGETEWLAETLILGVWQVKYGVPDVNGSIESALVGAASQESGTAELCHFKDL